MLSSKKLSILIISVPERHDELSKLYTTLIQQINECGHDKVELLVLTDNRSLTIGKKRQYLNIIANGDYIIHVDDDDSVHPQFVSMLLDAIQHNPNVDLITFIVSVSINNQPPKPCLYSSQFHGNMNFDTHYQRLPNTRCCFKKKIALKEEIPDISFGEDDEWGKLIVRHIKTEHTIDDTPLYFYNASTEKPSGWFKTQ